MVASIRTLLRRTGFDVVRWPGASTMHGISMALDRTLALGFAPRCIFDVGAYRGDFARQCLQRWPEAQVVCFEPLTALVARLHQLAAGEPRIRIVPGLLGADESARVVLHEAETASSVLPEHVQQQFPVSEHRMRSVDNMIARGELTPPDLLKLDVQGYELEVLKGAARTLDRVQLILAEVNFLDIHAGVPLAPQLFDWLARRGWVPYDICEVTRRPLDGALWQADFLFVPVNSALRRDKRWAERRP